MEPFLGQRRQVSASNASNLVYSARASTTCTARSPRVFVAPGAICVSPAPLLVRLAAVAVQQPVTQVRDRHEGRVGQEEVFGKSVWRRQHRIPQVSNCIHVHVPFLPSHPCSSSPSLSAHPLPLSLPLPHSPSSSSIPASSR